jgi:hypothetical protein
LAFAACLSTVCHTLEKPAKAEAGLGLVNEAIDGYIDNGNLGVDQVNLRVGEMLCMGTNYFVLSLVQPEPMKI